MIEIIDQRIDASESMATRLNKSVQNTTHRIEAATTEQANTLRKVSAGMKPESEVTCKNKDNTLTYLSLAALMIGGIGWIGTAALWSKVVAIGGGAGLVYSLCSKDCSQRKQPPVNPTKQPTKSTLPTDFIVCETTVLIDKLKKISEQWGAFSDSNKSILNTNLESMSMSEHDRFKAESLIRVPKTLSFPFIEYRNIMEEATTPEKLKDAVEEIAKLAIAEIDKVVTSQTDAYKEMAKFIHQAAS